MNDLPLSTGFSRHQTVSIYSADASLLLIYLKSKADFGGRHPYTLNSPLASLQERNVSMLEGPPYRLEECGNQHATARRPFYFYQAWVCGHVCVSQVFYAPLLVFTWADTVRLDFTRTLMGKGTTKIPGSKYQQLGLAVRCFFCHATQPLLSQTKVPICEECCTISAFRL